MVGEQVSIVVSSAYRWSSQSLMGTRFMSFIKIMKRSGPKMLP